MRKFLVAMMVVGIASVAGAVEPNLGPNLPGNGGGFNTNDGGIVWDNGTADGVNGWRPITNWDPDGILDSFTLEAGDSSINGMRAEFVDGTFPIGVPDTVHSAMRMRVFEGNPYDINLNIDVPVYDEAFTRASGDFTVSDSGEDLFGRDLLYFDVSGAEVDLGPGDYSVMVSFPGSGVVDSFFATSAHPCTAGVDCGRILGVAGEQGPIEPPTDFAWNITVPEPASLALLGLGALAMIRRR